MNDGWYVAEPDGTAHGPMRRADAVRLAGRADYGDAMAWHVDLGEWIPLSKVLMRFGRGNQETAELPVQNTAPAAERPQKRRDQAAAQRAEAAPGKANTAAAERKRRVAETVRQPPPLIPREAAVDPKAAAAESAAKLGVAGKRLFARYLDVMSIGLLAAVVLSALLGRDQAWAQRLSSDGGVPDVALLLWLAFAMMVLLDTILLASFGTTPGKSLLGLRVLARDGSKPSWAQAWQRAVLVFARGCGLGIPVVSQIAILVAGVQTLNSGTAPWDSAQELRVHSTAVESGQWKIIVIAAIVLWIAVADGWWLDLYAALSAMP